MFFAMPQALYPALAVYYGEKYIGLFPAAIAGGALIASLTSRFRVRTGHGGTEVHMAFPCPEAA